MNIIIEKILIGIISFMIIGLMFIVLRDLGKAFIQKIKKLCKQHKALILVDEVQSGAGRTGTLLAYEQFGIKPDIMCSLVMACNVMNVKLQSCTLGWVGGVLISALLVNVKFVLF